MSAGWTEFWRDLERQAVPRVEAELATVQWKLTSTRPWRAVADHGRPLKRPFETATAASADELVEKVRAAEVNGYRTCCEGECEECMGSDLEEP